LITRRSRLGALSLQTLNRNLARGKIGARSQVKKGSRRKMGKQWILDFIECMYNTQTNKKRQRLLLVAFCGPINLRTLALFVPAAVNDLWPNGFSLI